MIGGFPQVEARISLLPAESGGLTMPLQSGTRSLVVCFPSPENHSEMVQVGAAIDSIDAATLEPGAVDTAVRLTFWADEAAIYATPGATFDLWLGQVVGHGIVDRIVDELDDNAS